MVDQTTVNGHVNNQLEADHTFIHELCNTKQQLNLNFIRGKQKYFFFKLVITDILLKLKSHEFYSLNLVI